MAEDFGVEERGRVLRPGRRAPRRRAEPPAPGARARRDGAARRATTTRSRAVGSTCSVRCRQSTRPRVHPGQYVGYRDIEGVEPDSDTETFVALRLEIENWRWAGVPILVRAGKALARTATEIVVRLQRVPQLRWGTHMLDCPGPRRHRPAHRAPAGHVDLALRARRPARKSRSRCRSTSTSRRSSASRRAVRAPARGRAARRQHALPALGGDRGDVADRAALLDDPPPDREVRARLVGACVGGRDRRATAAGASPQGSSALG